MEKFELEIISYGEKALLLKWPEIISDEILLEIIHLKKELTNKFPKLIITSAYSSILVKGKEVEELPNNDEILKLHRELEPGKNEFETHRIPVCYDESFAVDLEEMSDKLGLSSEEIISIHTSGKYRVFFNGFLPGFAYLGGLDERLFIDRKEKPSLKVEEGSVAIGGNQTGIYPQVSPGGWFVIGRTPIKMFDKERNKACLVKAGDFIEFYSISQDEYDKLKVEKQ